MITRRRFLDTLGGAGALAACPWARPTGAHAPEDPGVWVNDIHSRLNRTRVRRVLRPDSVAHLRDVVRQARAQGAVLSVAAGRHAMGGQQFGDGTRLIDMNGLARLVRLDRARGTVEVEAGMQWPALVEALERAQEGDLRPWSIVQKQTGADRLSVGGALAANAHGRGLRLRPIVQDVESFTLIDAQGRLRRCSRGESAELFRLAIGGYGLMGVIATVTLRLMPRLKLERVVEIGETASLMAAFEARIAEGYLYGDFQFSTDAGSEGFLRRGVFSCYRPADPARPVTPVPQRLSEQDWIELIALGHADKRRAFDVYSSYYLSTSGQVYWSDRHQLSTYVDGYHAIIDRRLGAGEPGTEMITEVYVPRPALHDFMEAVRRDFLAHQVDFIYGTVRLIERDEECFLTWAREAWACIIFNLHVAHDPAGRAKAAADFRRLIDRALERGGSYFLTYHRWAARTQVERGHPRLVGFLRRKRRHDPEERFQSDWYRHYRTMFADAL